MAYSKRQRRNPHTGLLRGLALLFCLAMLLSSVPFGGIAATAEAAENTVTVTVNYVYKSNNAMVAQPYTAQLEKGAAFQKLLELPKLLNYSIPSDTAVGLSEDIVLSKNETTGRYTLNFNLLAVNEDVTVTLYYVAGTAKYTVYHYYQNLETDEYSDEEPFVVELEGDIDAYTEAVANNRAGYRCNGVPQTTIAADGTTKVEIYYDREYYTVVFDVSGGVDGPEPIYGKYGTEYTTAEVVKEPRRVGYTFLGWSPALSDTLTIEGNITYVAQWQPEKGQADYTVVIWGQNANDDEYSYLGSYAAWGNVGNQVTWADNPLISHVHTDDCYATTCGTEEHTHSDTCYTCGEQEHTHTKACYGSDVGGETWSGSTGKPENPQQGEVYIGYLGKYIYIDGTWYDYTGSTSSGSIAPVTCGLDAHTHGESCIITCGKAEHTHDAGCGTTLTCTIDTTVKYINELHPGNLWELEKSDTVIIDADRSTVLNVYFTRKVFTLTFYANRRQVYQIQERWGRDIREKWPIPGYTSGERWNPSGSSTYNKVLVHIDIMPSESFNLTVSSGTGNPTYTMNYYVEVIDGSGEKEYGGKYFTKAFTVKAKYNYVTEAEDFFALEGFTKWEADPAFSNGQITISGNNKTVDFYYTRNSYQVEFYSASLNQTDTVKEAKYEENLGGLYYVPENRPQSVESDALFVGWYLNPQYTGEQYDLSAHTMPSHSIALYAKWVNGLYTVKTFTDDTLQALYTYDGYTGVQEDIEKYTLAAAPTDPHKDGYVFIGWFYRDGEVEKPFSFTLPITRDYDLYPKFSEPKAVEYTVHYYKDGTTEKVADDRTNSVMLGTTVTEKAKMGTELNLLPADKQNKYYPTNTGTSVIINQLDQEIIFYYTEAQSVDYTVYYQNANGVNLRDPVTKTTEFSTVTEQYVPIPNYAPRQFSITQDLSSDASQNKIIFVYDPTLTTLTIQKSGWNGADENQTFLFRVKGTDESTAGIDLTVTVHGNGKTTITELPVGSYTVTELTDWSWRYTPSDGATQNITADAGGAVLAFANSRTEEKWLDGDSFGINLFGLEQ